MRCLICNATFNDDVLKSHYQYYHSIKENSYCFGELFLLDNVSKRCHECKLEIKFIFITTKLEAAGTSNLPINVLRRGSIFYYSINFYQHKNFYDFYNEKIVDPVLNSVCERFVPGKDFKIQGYVELINYLQIEIVNKCV